MGIASVTQLTLSTRVFFPGRNREWGGGGTKAPLSPRRDPQYGRRKREEEEESESERYFLACAREEKASAEKRRRKPTHAHL